MEGQTLDLLSRLLDMVGTGGDAAFWLALAYIFAGKIAGLLVAAGLFATIFLVVRQLIRVNEYTVFSYQVRRAAKVNCGGTIYEDERHRVLELIEKGLQLELIEKGLQAEQEISKQQARDLRAQSAAMNGVGAGL